MTVEDLALACMAANKARTSSYQFRVHWPLYLPGQDYLRVDDPWADNIRSAVLRTVWFGLGRREGVWLNGYGPFLEARHTGRWAAYLRDADAMLDGELAALAGRVKHPVVVGWFDVTEEPATAP